MIWLVSLSAAAVPTVQVELAAEATGAPVPALFGLGGNVWHMPAVFDAGVAERILAAGQLGTTRVSLGDLVLQDSRSLADVQARLTALPLNDFLRRYAAAGGKVLLTLDGMPHWLSTSRSRQRHAATGQPLFRRYPPRDDAQWSAVVESVVRHFNGTLGLDAYYEVWNEPNFYYAGKRAQFLQQYYATVLGARRADARARVGGPAVSDFLSLGTAGDAAEERQQLQSRLLQRQWLFRAFLDYAAATPVPELGLTRLPVDFFSWHGFYMDPARYYATVVPAFRQALAAAGYAADTPLINTEWNLADVPPYPEGDLNSGAVGAAFAASSLIAMHEAGVARQSFQMYVDPGTPAYYGGMFDVSGMPRASFHALSLFARLQGKAVAVRSSDPWLKAVAYRAGSTTYLLLSSCVPTPRMRANVQAIRSVLDHDVLGTRVLTHTLSGQPLPAAVAAEVAVQQQEYRAFMQAEQDKAAAWQAGVDIEIRLSAAPLRARHFLIDAQHSNGVTALARAQDFLRRVHAAPAGMLQRQQRHREALQEIERWPEVQLHQAALAWPADGQLRLRSAPHAVHLFVLDER